MALDFRLALNTISDVVQNRPPPLREFDQIYMKVGDLVIQAEFIARKFDDLSVVFIGDGDAISLSVMHLKEKEVYSYGPQYIQVLDFDERVVNSINKFVYENDMTEKISASLYNVCDPLPTDYHRNYDAFYTNPPWGASNEGQSVIAFVQRGIEAIKTKGMGAIVIADDKTLPWTSQVLLKTQRKVVEYGFIVSEMIPELHQYHLDDAPDLTSCCILIRDIEGKPEIGDSTALDSESLQNFYGRKNPLRISYVKDLSGLNRGKAPDSSYELIPLEE